MIPNRRSIRPPRCSTCSLTRAMFTVAKLRSTTSGVEVGLKRATNNASEPVVTPLGKYHCCAVVLWHGAMAQPDGPCSTWETATPPPDSVMASESHVPVLGVGT